MGYLCYDTETIFVVWAIEILSSFFGGVNGQRGRIEDVGVMMIPGFLRSRLALVLAGIGCELLYFFYLLRQFPLLRSYNDLIDMGMVTKTSHAGFLWFLLVFSVLFALFGFAWWQVRQLQDHATLWLILGFGAIFALTNIFVYPITAIDVFNYIAESIVMLDYHANPMIVSLAQYPHDSLVRLTVGWGIYPASYGPIGLLIDAIPTLFAGRNVLANLLLLKLLFSSVLLLEAFVAYKILLKIGPKFALAGALALAWNPFALFEYSANGHNDILMVLFILLAVLALVEERPVLALVLVTASALTKYASLPLIPLFFAYSVVHQPSHQQRLRYAGVAIATSLLLVLITFTPFWAGPRTFDSLFFVNRINLSSFNMFLNDISSKTISLDQAKQPGLVIFGLFYIYALFLCTRRIEDMLRGCFIAMFALLAFGVTNIEVWYAIWPFALAVVIPDTGEMLIASLLIYGATLTELVHAYVWPWINIQTNTFAYDIVNSIAYLVIFLPAFLLLLFIECRNISSYTVQFLAIKKKGRDEVADMDVGESPVSMVSGKSVGKEE